MKSRNSVGEQPWLTREIKTEIKISWYITNCFWSVVALCLLFAIIWFVRFSYGLYTDKKQAEANLSEGQELNLASGKTQDGFIELDGKLYRRNTAIRAILCIGVDTQGELESYQASGVAGQADGLFLVAQDMARDTVRILMIPRDTMTEITLFDLMGNELGKDTQHLTLAFAYGDGKKKAVSFCRRRFPICCLT